MKNRLKNKRVAILLTHGFEESECKVPHETLKEAGATVDVIALEPGTVRSWSNGKWGEDYKVDLTVKEADVCDYDALVLPGGVINSDKLRQDPAAIEFAGEFFDGEKPIAAICHALWILIETGELKGKNVTSYPSLKTDLKNAGANWVDEEVSVDTGLITSRRPDDLPAFCKMMIKKIQEGSPAIRYALKFA